MRPLWFWLALFLCACGYDHLARVNARIAEHPNDPDAWYDRARSHFISMPKEAPECIADADKALELGPQSPNRYMYFATRGLCKASLALGRDWYKHKWDGSEGDVLPPEKRGPVIEARKDFDAARALVREDHKAMASLLDASARVKYKAGDHAAAQEDLVKLWELLSKGKRSWNDDKIIVYDGRTELMWLVDLASVDFRNAEALLKEAREQQSPALDSTEATFAATKDRYDRAVRALNTQQWEAHKASFEKVNAPRVAAEQRRQEAAEERARKYPNHETCPRCNGSGEIKYMDYGDVAICAAINSRYDLCTQQRSGGERTSSCPQCKGLGLVPKKSGPTFD